jgi:hypothetical protein
LKTIQSVYKKFFIRFDQGTTVETSPFDP